MKKRFSIFLFIAFVLSGCGFSGRNYVHVTPHNERTEGFSIGSAPAENYTQMLEALRAMIHSGTENAVIYTVKMDQQSLEQNMGVASRYLHQDDAIGAYAVEDISYEIGTTGGKSAVAVTVNYRHSGIELRRILYVGDTNEVEKILLEALEDCRPSLVMQINKYSELDIHQLMLNLARDNPEIVMEIPEMVEAEYGTQESRVIELSFFYENSRDALRQMQNQVKPVFESASLYVSGEAADVQKFAQLYSFLMERFDYSFDTSITPTYSLLHHGVGDSRAFATVYAAMCRRAGLECMTVTGAKNGEPRTWNIINDNGYYFHVDLLANSEQGFFREMYDSEMNGYVWDYSAYPACNVSSADQEPEQQP